MTTDLRTAVVLGTYNRRAMLERAIASAHSAAGKIPITIVVVDGGSVDGSQEWLRSQSNVVLIEQQLPLTGAVRAFNLGFGYAVDQGFPFVVHFNDDAEFVTDAAIEKAVGILQSKPRVGEVAFEFDLRGPWGFDSIHNRWYANFGIIRREVGMDVARRQGDPTGRAWWNPIYRTYGADAELGCWIWAMGLEIERGFGLRVHDCCANDDLRQINEGHNPHRTDSRLFAQRWPTIASMYRGAVSK
jgi:glycosyltransferase involved in cell wall biosynthesis